MMSHHLDVVGRARGRGVVNLQRGNLGEASSSGVTQVSKNIVKIPDLYDVGGRGVGTEGKDRTLKVADGKVAPNECPNRGSMRGRRILNEIIATKPSTLVTKRGTEGQSVPLSANYFRFITITKFELYQYCVKFTPEIELTTIRKQLLREHKSKLGGYIFDGTTLYVAKKMMIDYVELVSSNQENELIKIEIKFIKIVDMNSMDAIQVLNIIMRKILDGFKLQLVGRNYYDPFAKIPMPEIKLDIWPGYITSIRQHEEDILLCTETSFKIMRKESVLDVLNNCSRNERGNFKDDFTRKILGATVLTSYNNKTYHVDDINWEKTPLSRFETKNGNISYIDYYKNRYNIIIKEMQQPLLISRSKARDIRAGKAELIDLIPELCNCTGYTEDMRNDFRLMSRMAEHTKQIPSTRVDKLIAFNQRLSSNDNSLTILKEWGITIDTNMVEITGRILEAGSILLGKNVQIKPDHNADWTSAFRNNTLYMTSTLVNWVIIAPQKVGLHEAQEFSKILIMIGRGMGFNIKDPLILPIERDRTEIYIRAIDDAINKYSPQLIMFILPNNSSSRYAVIKKKCCVDRAIPSQVMVCRTITPKGGNPRGLMSVGTKVAIQMSCKLGMSPWNIQIPIAGLMTIGFDVCHDTQNKSKTASYGAIVASMDLKICSKYFSAVSCHPNGEELSNFFASNVIKALRAYINVHNSLPLKILIYRDGVGDGQLYHVINHELKRIQSSINNIYDNYKEEGKKLRLAFIIVNKRLNTRIFARDRNNYSNPRPGTIVDSIITLPQRYDFFLVSQSVRQGTVSPTSYNILHDEFGLSPSKMQILTYKMCHLYFNWSGTIRVPAVCQYAHKLAFLINQYIRCTPNGALDNQLYFL